MALTNPKNYNKIFKRWLILSLLFGLFGSLAITPVFATTNASATSTAPTTQVSNAELSNSETNQVSNTAVSGSQTAAAQTKHPKNRQGLLDSVSNFIRMGGVFIWPLFLLSILGLAYLLERGMFYLKRPSSDETLLQIIKGGAKPAEVVKHIKDHPSRMGDVISEVIRLSEKRTTVEQLDKVLEIGINIQISELQKGFTMINAVITLSPLVGFLGTVSGMIAAFASIATSDQVSVTLVAKGIQEALITTEVGLIIAITVNFFYSIFQQSIEKFGQYSIDAGETLIERIVEDED